MENREIKFLSLEELKNDWEELELLGNTSPYQYYRFLNSLPLSTSPRDIFKSINYDEFNVALYKEGKCQIIIPLVIEKVKHSSCKIRLRGYDFGAGLLGILYREGAVYRDFKYCMDELLGELKKKYRNCYFKFGRLQDNVFIEWLDLYLLGKEYAKYKQKCVAINVKHGYKIWYESLRKAMRQNIRTMYNRIHADSVSVECKVYVNEVIDTKIYDELQMLYSKRIMEKNHLIKFPWVQPIVYFFKKHNGFVKALNSPYNSFHSLIRINGFLVAFMSGVIVNNQKRTIIPHLAYNTDFKRYSPGVLLVCETIKYITRDGGFNILDLSCGAEDYKYSLGGEEYVLEEYCFCG